MSRLRLTPLGEIINRYSVITPPQYWQGIIKEFHELNEDGSGNGFDMLEERSKGMLAIALYYIGADNPVKEEPKKEGKP
jgi:hypothetical protein